MTTCRQVITYALRQSKVIASGDDPSSDEAEDGLIALQSMYDDWVSGGMFGRLTDKYMTENENVEEGIRYYVPTGLTLTENVTIAAEDSFDGLRQPRDLSLYESLTQAGVRTVKLYDRTAWVALTGLTLASDAPLASRGAFSLAAALAVSGGFAAMFGSAADIGPDTRNLAASFLGSLSYKLGSTRDRAAAEYF